MTRTQPVHQPVNRLGFDSPPARPMLPQSERDRGKLWSDIVFEAALALRGQLTSRNENIVAAAANTLIDLERTRMRHSRPVAGSSSQSEAQEEFDRESRNRWATEDADEEEIDGEEQEELEAQAETIIRSAPAPAPAPVAKTSTPIEKPEPPPYVPDRQLGHALEVRAMWNIREDGKPEVERRPMTLAAAEELVAKELEASGVRATDIPPGEFWERVRG